jgi:hypothetical protein
MRRFKSPSGCVHILDSIQYHGRNVPAMLCGRRDWERTWRETVRPQTCQRCIKVNHERWEEEMANPSLRERRLGAELDAMLKTARND